jgi:hypothetical protein
MRGLIATCPGKSQKTVRSWRRERDSNPRYAFTHTRFPSVRLKPLGHLSRTPPVNTRHRDWRKLQTWRPPRRDLVPRKRRSSEKTAAADRPSKAASLTLHRPIPLRWVAYPRDRSDVSHRGNNQDFRRYRCQASIFKAARKADCGMSTLPNWRIRFLPSFCFSSSLRLRVISPP